MSFWKAFPLEKMLGLFEGYISCVLFFKGNYVPNLCGKWPVLYILGTCFYCTYLFHLINFVLFCMVCKCLIIFNY